MTLSLTIDPRTLRLHPPGAVAGASGGPIPQPLTRIDMTRITDNDLDTLAHRINEATGSPLKPYVDGKAQIGNYHISRAYGGVCLHRIHNTGGGVTTPLYNCHDTKRRLYDAMHAFLAGIGAKGQ